MTSVQTYDSQLPTPNFKIMQVVQSRDDHPPLMAIPDTYCYIYEPLKQILSFEHFFLHQKCFIQLLILDDKIDLLLVFRPWRVPKRCIRAITELMKSVNFWLQISNSPDKSLIIDAFPESI